jgi:glucose 1-dehydrogenase
VTAAGERLLEGQKALVTGASSGIGQAIAVAFAEAGADVAVNFVGNREAAAETVARIAAHGTRGLAIQADVSREDQVVDMFATAIGELGRIDILVNNAGLQKDAPFDEMTLEQWNRVIEVNLTGQFLCAREAVRAFKRQGVIEGVSRAAGKILCISSVHEIIPWAGHVNYAASKGGVMLMMKSIAQELAPDRIRVNSIAPGAIRTDINREVWSSREGRDELRQLIPYNRIGESDEIGRIAAWLVSDQADYIVGASIVVDGGMALYPGFADGG